MGHYHFRTFKHFMPDDKSTLLINDDNNNSNKECIPKLASLPNDDVPYTPKMTWFFIEVPISYYAHFLCS